MAKHLPLKLTQLLQSDPAELYQQALDLRQEKAGELALQAAHRMFTIASLMGMPAARYHLGLMNLRGEGRERDRVRALMWFRLAGGGTSRVRRVKRLSWRLSSSPGRFDRPCATPAGVIKHWRYVE